jgi:hypothetical protein
MLDLHRHFILEDSLGATPSLVYVDIAIRVPPQNNSANTTDLDWFLNGSHDCLPIRLRLIDKSKIRTLQTGACTVLHMCPDVQQAPNEYRAG